MPPFIDETGNRYGRLVALKLVEKGKRGTIWLWRCDCGKEKAIDRKSIANGPVRSCGCLSSELSSKRSRIDITGMRFGRYTVIKYYGLKHEAGHWFARCDCGVEKVVRGSNLRDGTVVSCGCWKIEKSIERNTTHGLSKTKEYNRYKTAKYNDLKKKHDFMWSLEKEQFLRNLFQQCVVCGITENEHKEKFGQSLHVDHIQPLKYGNGLSVDNATILCAECNRKKHAKQLDDLPKHVASRIKNSSKLFQLLWDGIR